MPSAADTATLGRQSEGHAGVTTATDVRIERNEIEQRMTTLRKLAQALDADPSELVGDF